MVTARLHARKLRLRHRRLASDLTLRLADTLTERPQSYRRPVPRGRGRATWMVAHRARGGGDGHGAGTSAAPRAQHLFQLCNGDTVTDDEVVCRRRAPAALGRCLGRGRGDIAGLFEELQKPATNGATAADIQDLESHARHRCSRARRYRRARELYKNIARSRLVEC